MNDNKNQIEQLIDNLSLNEMIHLMAEICKEKSQHVRENWQDKKLANTWDKDAKTLEKFAKTIYN